MYPREIEVLLGRIAHEARDVLAVLEFHREHPHEEVGKAIARIDAMINGVRELAFDAGRASAIAELDANTLRECYAQSVVAVDWVRTKGALGDPLDPIADIQEALQALFPGDTLEA